MVILKIGVLSGAIYLILTILLEAGVVALTHFSSGFGYFIRSKNMFLGFGARFGLVFGLFWAISFAVAWSIVYAGLKAKLNLG